LGRQGDPRGCAGAAIHPLARILAACQGLDVFVSTQVRPGVAVLAERLGSWYDPDIADALLDACRHGFFTIWPPRTSRAAPWTSTSGQIRTSDDADVDRSRLRSRHRRRQEPYTARIRSASPMWPKRWRHVLGCRPGGRGRTPGGLLQTSASSGPT